MKFLIQNMSLADEKLKEAAERAGHQVYFYTTKDIYCNPEPFNYEMVALHTSCLMMDHLNSRGFVTLTPRRFLDCSYYYAYWGKYLMNRGYYMMPLGDVKNLVEELDFDDFMNGPFFLRPDHNNKVFTGFLCESTVDLDDLLYGNEPHTLVVAAPRKKFAAEWRYVIYNGEIVTSSLYRQHGVHDEIDHGDGLLTFPDKYVQEIIKEPFPGLPKAYVLDIALEDDSDNLEPWTFYRREDVYKLGLLEIGSINCAGFYSCDLDKVIEVLSIATEETFNEQQIN